MYPSRPPGRQRGFILVFMLALLTMGVLYMVVSRLDTNEYKATRTGNTADSLAQAKAALIGYAATYRDNHPNEGFGYLPCPDTTGNGEAPGSCDTAGTTVVGLLPYKTLGLPDLRDNSGNCLWYAVSGSHKNSPKTTPLNWDTQGLIQVQDMNGNTIAKPDDANGGAVAVIFAPGPPLSSQSRATNDSVTCNVADLAANTSEYRNYLDGVPDGVGGSTAYSLPSATNPLTLVQGAPDVVGTVNNDRILWITAKEVFDQVKKRSDFATYVSSGIYGIQGWLNNNLSRPVPTGNALPSGFSGSTSNQNFYDNWYDNFRYLPCATANSYCYRINDQDCDGALLFGGLPSLAANGTTSPRPSTKRADSYYFETGASGGLDLLNGTRSTVTGAAQTYLSGQTSDVIQCLTPLLPVQISASQMFATTNPTVSGSGANPLMTPTGSTLTIGTTSVGTDQSQLYGCLWYPTMVPFGSGLRAYFEYTVAQRGEGFTFTIADADPARNPSLMMCGSPADALGYAGNNGVTSPINYPKIALEFDFRASNPGPLGITRNDPTTMHYAFDYWGAASDVDDDDTHGAGGGSAPLNPASGSTGLQTLYVPTNRTVYIRVDIDRTYTASSLSGAYTLKAYIVRAELGNIFPSDRVFCQQSDLSNLTDDLSVVCPTFTTGTYSKYVSDSIAISDVSGSEALRRIYLGFTTGQCLTSSLGGSSSCVASPQSISVTNFQAVTY